MGSEMCIRDRSKLGRSMMKVKSGVQNPDGSWTFEGLTKRQVREINELGITNDMIMGIAEQVQKHGTRVRGGSVHININDWDGKIDGGLSQQAMDVRDAVVKEVQNTIIEPTAGEVPWLGKTVQGSLIMQFKTFLLASTSKYFMQDMQRIFRGDMRGAERQMAFWGMGYLVTEAKTELYGLDRDDRTPTSLAADIFANGGGGGIVAEILNGLQHKYGAETARYSGNRTVEGMLIGAGTQQLLQQGKVISDLLSGHFTPGIGQDATSSSTKNLRKSIPGNNFLFTRPIVNKGEEELYDILG